jgi:predicted  nucleic acid-binding Zn-ribbon protein
MNLIKDDDYFDLSATKEMKEIKNLLTKVLDSIDAVNNRLNIIEGKIDVSQSLTDIGKKIDALDEIVELTDTDVRDIGGKICSIVSQIEHVDKKADRNIYKIDEHLKEVEKKVDRMSVYHSNANVRMINAMLRRNDPVPFSLSSSVQNNPNDVDK